MNAALAPIDWHRGRVIVEYGPGIGTFTAEILRRMRSDARLIVFETNPEFVQFMGNTFLDSRLRIEHDSAENVQLVLRRMALQRANYIVSGIPLGSMPKSLQAGIATASRDALEGDGSFLVYQFSSRGVAGVASDVQHRAAAIRSAQLAAGTGICVHGRCCLRHNPRARRDRKAALNLYLP